MGHTLILSLRSLQASHKGRGLGLGDVGQLFALLDLNPGPSWVTLGTCYFFDPVFLPVKWGLEYLMHSAWHIGVSLLK